MQFRSHRCGRQPPRSLAVCKWQDVLVSRCRVAAFQLLRRSRAARRRSTSSPGPRSVCLGIPDWQWRIAEGGGGP
jgi:hypothetical protein